MRTQVMLDTPDFNAHTTAVDALWVGVPLITLPLERMASRVSASLVLSAGLRLLVTRTLADYYYRMHAALSYACTRPYDTDACGLELHMHAALSYCCMRP